MAKFVAGLRVYSQADTRTEGNADDQHGRPYRATLEQRSGDPVGGSWLPDGWVSPDAPKGTWYRNRMRPDHKYVKVLRGRDGRDPKRNGHRCWIDYEAWLRDYDEAESDNQREMTEAIRQDAKERGLSMTQISDLIKNPPSEIYKAFPPRASARWPREFIVAAMRGNRWVLGLPHPETGAKMDVPPWAHPIIEAWLKRQPIGSRASAINDTNEYKDVGLEPEEGFVPIVDDSWTPEAEPKDVIPTPTAQMQPKKGGRKPGSKNKPKTLTAAQSG